jgi:transcriptional regulator with XRE-family HTH domain
MKGADLKAFRKANNLTQSELGEYLGVKKAFVSQMESDKCPIPSDKFNKLINNPYGWDTSLLSQSNSAEEVAPIKEGALIAELRAQIERLESKVDNLNQELGEKNALLRMMRQAEMESI